MLKFASYIGKDINVPPYSLQPDINLYIWEHHLETEELNELYESIPLCNKDDEGLCSLHGKRYMERISIRILLKQLLGSQSCIHYLETGRPILTSGLAELSISHTKNIYAISLSKEKHGMDIEQWGSKALKLINMFLNEEEQLLLNDSSIPLLSSPERNATLLWSAKEAIYKYIDRPGLSFKEDISISYNTKQELKANVRSSEEELFVYFEALPHCILTCCKSTPFA